MPTGCQTTGGRDTTENIPWRGTSREHAKTKLARYVRRTPEGTPLSKIVCDVFDYAPGEYSSADYQLARRFFKRHNWFKIDRRGANLWVEPTLEHFTCTVSKQKRGTQDSDGEDGNTVENRSHDRYAKERAQTLLSKVTKINAESLQRDLHRELWTELESISDVVKVLERVRGSGPEYLFLPYKTRFNAADRARALKRKYDMAWDRATARYETAVAVTLTTDPARHDSIAGATDALLENFRRLHGDFLTYDPEGGPSRPGRRLDYISTLEFTDSGLPHLHVVFFGVPWLCPHATLKQYWSVDCEQGNIVYLQRLHQRNGRWVPERRRIADGGKTASGTKTADYDPAAGRDTRTYFGKQITTLVEVAETDTSNGLTDADDCAKQVPAGRRESRDYWKLALYWALGKQFWSGSQNLTTDDSDDAEPKLPHVTCYRFLGVAKYGNLPAHVRMAGRLLTGTPPDDRLNRSGGGQRDKGPPNAGQQSADSGGDGQA